MNPTVRVLKRVVDVAGSLVGLAVTVPLYPLIGAAIFVDSPGPIFYRQRRAGELIGQDDPNHFRFVEFDMLKFRTMRPDAEKVTGAVLATEGDPRVTRVGRFLRKTRLDELPQFWNVLLGDMSLVGPRPPIPEEVAQYERWQRRRLAMKPGLTCLWQISGRNELDFEQWMRLDLQYIDSWSPWLDFKILAKTVPVVLSGRGAS